MPSNGPSALDAFLREALVHLDEIFRVACRLMPDRASAEDVTQETFLRAWAAFQRFEQGTNCRAWLFRILFHVRAEECRRLKRAEAVVGTDALATCDPPSPGVVIRADLERALAALPDDFRTVITLADIEGLTYREIAEALDIPMGTVMSRLSRARRLVRRHLAGEPQAGNQTVYRLRS